MDLQINRFDTTLNASAEDLERIQAEFDQKHCVIFPKLLEPELLQSVLQGVEQADFSLLEYKHIEAKEIYVNQRNPTSCLMNFLMNNQTLMDIVQQVTNCGHIGIFQGRIYRMNPNSEHYDDWHDDLVINRRVAVSINLTPEPYSGGVVQICEWKSRQIVNEIHNTGLGDAMLFRIAPHLKHRVTSVEGSIPRTAFVGWFEDNPGYRHWMKLGGREEQFEF